MNTLSETRRLVLAFLFLAVAVTAWWIMHEGVRAFSAPHSNPTLDTGYQHAQRLQVAAARAALDAVALTGTDHPESYRADYRLQRMQIQADSEGLDRWAAHDVAHQGLLQEIRASLAGLLVALDQTAGLVAGVHAQGIPPASAGSTPNSVHIPLLPVLNRTEAALSNYAASLSAPDQLHGSSLLSSGPVFLWILLVLLLAELGTLAWLVFLSGGSEKTRSRP